MPRIMMSTALLAVVLLVSGCGHTPGDRAASGGMIGAATGAGVAALTGGAPLIGAAIGGAVGAVGGAATTGSGLNLGRPLWR